MGPITTHTETRYCALETTDLDRGSWQCLGTLMETSYLRDTCRGVWA